MGSIREFRERLFGLSAAAADEEQGIVLLRMNFGPGSTFSGGKTELDVWEAFKIYGGQIHAVEAYMEVVPAGTKSGWD